MRILLVVTEGVLRGVLAGEGFAVDVADASGAERAVRADHYDAIVVEGTAAAAVLRRSGVAAPILLLLQSGTEGEADRSVEVCGETGAGGSIAGEEIAVRVRELLGGHAPPSQSAIRVGDLLLERDQRRVVRGGESISLSLREYQLLEYLARRAGKVVTRAELRRHIWGDDGVESNVLEVYIRYLRNKLGREPNLIRTVRGGGYVLVPEESPRMR